LRKNWREWADIVEAFARRSDHEVNPEAYRALYNDLLEDCRSHAAAAGPSWADFFRSLEHTVKPWLNPETLGLADPGLLQALLQRCREVERRLSGRRGAWGLAHYAAALILAVGPLLGVLWFKQFSALSRLRPERADDWARLFRSLGRMLDQEPWLWAVLVLPLVTVVSLYLLSRNPRG
jgi:hypothetical protein